MEPQTVSLTYEMAKFREQGRPTHQQQATDSNIISKIINVRKEFRLNYFWSVNQHLSDKAYWQTLASIWMDTEVCSPNLGFWEELFRSTRRSRHKMMKKGDRKFWRKLPKVVTAYRAVNNPSEIKTALSWTLDRSVAETIMLSKGGGLASKTIPKSSIIAFFNRRHEKEIIVLS